MDSKLYTTEPSSMMRKINWKPVILAALIALFYVGLMYFLIESLADFHPIKPNYSDIRLYTNPGFKAQVVQQRNYRRAAKLNQHGIEQWVIRHNARKPQGTK